ncbi:MAG: NTP transferase domain-containing protein, partial [Coriobacteriia bacterium]|nr:NTP transferase domain-containing protein [Coriobacteriia bacterium]
MKNEAIGVDAIILAGGDGSVIDPATPVKGLVKVAGIPMVQWVLSALRQSKYVNKIAVVLPEGHDMSSWEHLADYVVFSNGLVSDNIIKAKDALNSDGFILSVTSDIPSV